MNGNGQARPIVAFDARGRRFCAAVGMADVGRAMIGRTKRPAMVNFDAKNANYLLLTNSRSVYRCGFSTCRRGR